MPGNQSEANASERQERGTPASARVDEIGKQSFPASDPPQAWTWEIARSDGAVVHRPNFDPVAVPVEPKQHAAGGNQPPPDRTKGS